MPEHVAQNALPRRTESTDSGRTRAPVRFASTLCCVHEEELVPVTVPPIPPDRPAHHPENNHGVVGHEAATTPHDLP